MRVSVIGCGMVGGALADVFEELLAQNKETLPLQFSATEIYRFDPFKALGDETEAYKSDIAFVCVPSPTKDGAQDLSAIRAVEEAVNRHHFQGILVIKSTVLPGTTNGIHIDLPHLRVCHCPEFLREKTAHEDLREMKNVPISGEKRSRELVCDFLRALGYSPIESERTEVTEVAKYMHNVYCAMKVAFCNEIFELCGHLGISYDEVIAAAQGGERIGTAHTKVPGPDGKFGYSGACFPKDVRALTTFAQDTGADFPLISSIDESNEMRRPHDWDCKEKTSK